MVVQHNLAAMNTNRMLGISTKIQAGKTEKLSSGYRINRSADDAAGLAISEKMRRQIRGLTQASINCQDGISMVQIADGALAEVHEMLDRCTELSVKAATGTLTNSDRSYIQSEIDQIKSEIDAISDRTTFNEIQILKGQDVESTQTTGGAATVGGLPSWVDGGSSFAAGQMVDTVSPSNPKTYGSLTATDPRVGAVIDFTALDADPSQFATRLAELGKSNSGFNSTCYTCDDHYSVKFVTGPAGPASSSSTGGNTHYIYEVSIDGVKNSSELTDRIIKAASNHPGNHNTYYEAQGGKLLVYDYRYDYATGGSGTAKAPTSKTSGVITPGVAYAADQLPKENPTELYIQAGAEAGQHIDIKLPSLSCGSLKITGTSVSTQPTADKAITDFKNAKEYISKERSRMGAYQNRLEHTIKNLDNVVENTTAAESSIRDADMAKLMVEYSNNNIISQAAQAMLAQANQSSQGVLSLLQ